MNLIKLKFKQLNLKKFGLFINDKSYFILNYNGTKFFSLGACPHKSGPIFLGQDLGEYIKCPWHDKKIAKKTLIKKNIPFLRTGNEISLLTEIHVSAIKEIKNIDKEFKSINCLNI